MIIQGLSQEEENWLRELVGNADPEDRLLVQKFPSGYAVELEPSGADFQASRRRNLAPLKLKPTPCSAFYEVIEAVADTLAELNK